MHAPKLAPVALAGLLALAALGALAPHAAAQSAQQTTTQVVLSPIDTPIRPLSGLAVVTGKVSYTYVGLGQANFIGTSIKLKVAEAPPWAIVTISPSTIVIPVSGTNPQTSITAEKDFKVIVAATADAPAFTPANLKISASADANSPLNPSSGDDSVPIQADFFSILDARTDNPIQQARPQTSVAYPLLVQNFGNANTKVTLSTIQQDPDLQIVVPPPLTLESRQTGGKQTQQTVNVQVQTPYHNGYLNKVGTATIKMTSGYALDTKLKGDESQVVILTTTKGFYVPGFEALLAAGAVAGAALVLRRRASS